jgi:hypothetical protein
MGLLEWAERRSQDEVREIVEGIQSDDIDDNRRKLLIALLEGTDDTIIEDAIEENGAIEDLLVALEVIPPRQQQWALPDDDADLIDCEDEIAEAQAATSMDLDDFPRLKQVISPGPSRSVAYFEKILEELKAGDPDEAEKLRALGVDPLFVDENRIELLFKSKSTVGAAIEEIQENISALESGSGSSGNGPEISPTGLSTVDDIAYDTMVKRVVPGRVRRDWLDSEDWMADPERVQLEQNLMEWVFREFNHSKRWNALEFNLKPDNRDMRMAQWAFSQTREGLADPVDAIEAGLPPEWFEA